MYPFISLIDTHEFRGCQACPPGTVVQERGRHQVRCISYDGTACTEVERSQNYGPESGSVRRKGDRLDIEHRFDRELGTHPEGSARLRQGR